MKFNGQTLFKNTPVEIVLADTRVQEIREVSSTDSTTYVAPALIDIQVNGFAGFDLNVATVTSEDVRAMVRAPLGSRHRILMPDSCDGFLRSDL